VSGEDGDGVWDVEDEVMGCAVNIAVEPLMASELVSEALVWLEELVAAAVGRSVTACGVAVVVLSSCVVAVCVVVDAAAAVCSALWVVVIPRILSARLSIGEKISRAWRGCRWSWKWADEIDTSRK
jgi:hypothetical protein